MLQKLRDLIGQKNHVIAVQPPLISTIYNLSQIISQPTRITNTSKTLLDLCFTNYSDKVRLSGTHSLGKSDHSLIYLIRKSSCQVINTNFPVAMRQ